MLLSHLRHQDEIGHMIQIMKENAQLVIGFYLRPLMYNPQVFIRYIESSWITSVWEFLHSIKGQVHLEDSWELGIQWVLDQNLMDIWTNPALNLAPKELKRLNACRPPHFLQVVTIADICDATERFITRNILKGNHHTDRRSSYKWPHQQKPSPLASALWRKTLGWTISTTPTGRLRIPLGKWLSRPMHQHWTFHLDMTKHPRLVEQTEGGLYRIYSQGHTLRTFQTSSCIAF